MRDVIQRNRDTYAKRKAKNPPIPRVGFVYVMECQPLLRVGFSSNPEKRLDFIARFDIPDSIEEISNEIELLCYIPGGFDDERRVHHSLDTWLYSGSWYVDCADLRAALRVHGFDIQPTDKPFVAPKIAKWLSKAREELTERMNTWT